MAQLRLMHLLTGDDLFSRYADRWETYARSRTKRTRALCYKAPSSSAITRNLVKILYVSQYFLPEMGAPAARVAELSRYWAQDGHDITVLTGFPNHPTGVVPSEYRRKLRRLVARENADGVNVVRTWLLPFPNRKTYERMLNYSSFCLSAAATGLFTDVPTW